MSAYYRELRQQNLRPRRLLGQDHVPLDHDASRLHVTTDEWTAWIRGGRTRRLLDYAGVYRRRFDPDQECWMIPKRELHQVVTFAWRQEARIVTIDNCYWMPDDGDWWKVDAVVRRTA